MTTSHTDARERVLAAAESLFGERGFHAVTMRDVAEALGIRQASLYYHAPGGKEELFIAVVERTLDRHRVGLERALAGAPDGVEAQLGAAAGWLLSQPPVGLLRMLRSDMPALGEENAERLSTLAFRSILAPLGRVFARGEALGELRRVNPQLLAGSFLSVIDGIAAVTLSRSLPVPAEAMAAEMIGVFLRGLIPAANPAGQ